MLTKGMIRINEAIPDDYGLAKGFDVLVNFFPTTTPFLALIWCYGSLIFPATAPPKKTMFIQWCILFSCTGATFVISHSTPGQKHRVTTQQLKSKGARQIYWAKKFHLPRNMTVETQNANDNNLWMLYAAYQLRRHYDPRERNGVFLLGCFLSPFVIQLAYQHQTTIELWKPCLNEMMIRTCVDWLKLRVSDTSNAVSNKQ